MVVTVNSRRNGRYGYDVGTFHVERGDGPQWVCRSFGWPISVGKSNTPLLQMHPVTVSFGEGLICLMLLNTSCGPLGGGWPHSAQLHSLLNCWDLAASSGENISVQSCSGVSAILCPWT